MLKNFELQPVDKWTPEQFLLNIPMYKHKELEVYASEYDFIKNDRQGLREQDLIVLFFRERINGVLVRSYLYVSKTMINDDEYIQQIINEELDRMEKLSRNGENEK